MKNFRNMCALVAILAVLSPLSAWSADGNTLNIYSARHYDVDKEVYASFEKETGIKINVVEGKGNQLLERLTREKGQSEADLFLSVGAEILYPLKDRGLLGEYSSKTVEKNIPQNYRGKGWMGITSRARIIAYSLDRVDPSTIKTYDDLTAPRWKGKVLVRSSSSSYNVTLLASFIQLYGPEKAAQWAKGIVANFARTPKGNDRAQAKAIVAGEGDLAIMNSYYYIKMLRSSDQAEAAVPGKIGLIFPKNTHLNLSVAAMVAGAKNRDNAVKFLEYLSSEPVQRLYAEANGEFPLNPAVALPKVQASWGSFSTQKVDFENLGKFSAEAAMIFDKAGWK